MRFRCVVRLRYGGGVGFGHSLKPPRANGADDFGGFVGQSGGKGQQVCICKGAHAPSIRQLGAAVMPCGAVLAFIMQSGCAGGVAIAKTGWGT